MSELVHRTLPCGVEFAAEILPGRPTAALEIRILAGYADEPADKLGLARLLEQVVDKGTARRDGRGVLDAFDAIGAQRSSATGRHTTAFSTLVLPEFLPQALDLHAEMLRTPTLPQDACDVAVELASQELSSLEDDPQSLAEKLIDRQAYGAVLGRHPLGERGTLETITRADIEAHWHKTFAAGRMLVCVAGDVNVDAVAEHVQKCFDGFGSAQSAGRNAVPIEFAAARTHHAKELEQEQIAICYPGVALTDKEYPTEQVMLGVLSGGMSSRLFAEVREKQGLVYWVGAWSEHPRSAGMIHLGASTTPERCDKTFETLLREVDRLRDDLEPGEVQRAIVGITARTETRGDITRAHCTELVNDLFHHGHPIPIEEKVARIQAVDVAAIQRYLDAHPRNVLSVVTLGPRELSAASGDATA